MLNDFIIYAKSVGLYVGTPMQTEPKFSHPCTQSAWDVWKYLKGNNHGKMGKVRK